MGVRRGAFQQVRSCRQGGAGVQQAQRLAGIQAGQQQGRATRGPTAPNHAIGKAGSWHRAAGASARPLSAACGFRVDSCCSPAGTARSHRFETAGPRRGQVVGLQDGLPVLRVVLPQALDPPWGGSRRADRVGRQGGTTSAVALARKRRRQALTRPAWRAQPRCAWRFTAWIDQGERCRALQPSSQARARAVHSRASTRAAPVAWRQAAWRSARRAPSWRSTWNNSACTAGRSSCIAGIELQPRSWLDGPYRRRAVQVASSKRPAAAAPPARMALGVDGHSGPFFMPKQPGQQAWPETAR